MKFLITLVALVSVAMASPLVQPSPAVESIPWTLQQLDEALSNPMTNPVLIPYLEAGLNQMMDSIMAGHEENLIMVTMPVVPLEVPVVAEAAAVEAAPAVAAIPWTLNQLSEALQNPNLNPALVPYLEAGLNQLMISLMSGSQEQVIMVTMPIVPLEVAPVQAPEVPVATPVVVAPVAPVPVAPVEVPVAPVESPASSPLVQIVININNQAEDQVVAGPAVVPVAPEAVTVVESAVDAVNVVDTAVDAVSVVEVSPVVVVDAAPAPVNPIDVIAITAPETNPLDVIAVSAPEINPVDIMNPVPQPAGAVEIGPM